MTQEGNVDRMRNRVSMPFWRSRTWLLWMSLWIRDLPAFGVANGSLSFLSGTSPWGRP